MTTPTIEPGHTFIFTTPYSQYRTFHGRPATVLHEIDHSTIDYDEVGPMYRIRFEGGTEIDAWPEEIDPTLWERRL